MGRSGIEQLLYAMDRAFEGIPGEPGVPGGEGIYHPFMQNLGSTDRSEWTRLPENGRRSIAALVEDLGNCKYVYNSQAFGGGSIHWDKPGTLPPVDMDGPVEAIHAWLHEAHRGLRESLAGMQDDDELLVTRRCPQGWDVEARWIFTTMIEHDLYHSGEVNHIRALLQGND